MNKLKTAIFYECTTSFKYIWIFYGIVFAVVAIISALIYIGTGGLEHVGTNALEVNTLIYLSVVGVLEFKEDFKMLIQNGFTRKYIFLATSDLFVFISGTMALIDTIVGNVMHVLSDRYNSLFAGLYGYEHGILLNWLWLFLCYMAICGLMNLMILAINKIGKFPALIAGIGLGAVIVLFIPDLFAFVLPDAFTGRVIRSILKIAGFMENGTINFLYPLLFLLTMCGIFYVCAYLVIRRTELKS